MNKEIKPVFCLPHESLPAIAINLNGVGFCVASSFKHSVEFVTLGGAWWRAEEVLTSDFLDQMDSALKEKAK